MIDREKVIRGLKCCAESDYHKCDECPYCAVYCDDLLREALVLLRAQEPIEARLHLCESCSKVYPECDATVDGTEYGCGVGNDNVIGCEAYVNRWKAQEPVKPKVGYNIGPTWWYACGACSGDIDPQDGFCRHCGRKVKWE